LILSYAVYLSINVQRRSVVLLKSAIIFLVTGAAGLRDRELEGVRDAGDSDPAALGDPLPVGLRPPVGVLSPVERQLWRMVGVTLTAASAAVTEAFGERRDSPRMSSADDALAISFPVTIRAVVSNYTCYHSNRTKIRIII